MAETKVKSEKKVAIPKKVSTAKATSKPTTATAKKPAAAKKTATAKSSTRKTKSGIADLELRYRMIEVAAYFIAEKDGFSGNPVDYWIAAEAQISSTE